jgi:subtilase family serine protease
MIAIGSRPRVPTADKKIGRVSPTTQETAAVILRPRHQAALTKFISSVTNKNSVLYHQYLPRGAFRSRFGPSTATIAQVQHTIAAEGLQTVGISSNGLVLTIRGTAAQVESAFRTSLDSYRLPTGGIGQAAVIAPRVPATIAKSVAAIVGLDNLLAAQPADIIPKGSAMSHGFRAAKRANLPSVAGAPAPCADAQQDAATSGGLTDDQIANAYGAFGLYQQGDFGQGQSIAVYELQPFLTSDVSTFDTCYFGATESGQMTNRLAIIPVDGGELQPGPGSQNDEADLDVEDVSALAPQANVDVYEAPNTTFGGLDEYTQIVDGDTDQVVTSSWAVCEQLAQVAEPGLQQAENLLFEQAAAQGQTVLSAAGDTGDDSCNEYRSVPPPAGQNLLSLLDPASQPYVVSVGGTTIDNATQPPSEHVWNDGADWGGGGVSESWQMPSWQRSVALTSANSDDVSNAESLESATASDSAPLTTPTFCDGTLGIAGPCRETPDVSAQADEFTGSITIYGQSLGYGNPNGWATIGGTSSASPIWASMLALTNASSSCSGDLINGVPDAGFASPILYGIASDPAAYAASFNDITSGNNDLYGLDNGLVFPARTGYDMASGLGSPQLTAPGGGNGLSYYACQYGSTLSPPIVTGLNPSFGSTAGGQTIEVSGHGFGTSADPLVKSVSVGGGSAVSFSVDNNTTLSVTLPAADTTTPPGSPNPTEDGAGPDQIVVTSTDGQSSAPSARSLFQYVDEISGSRVPSVTSLSPYGGLDSGPKTVTVFGSDFASSPTPTVDFGGVPATNVDVLSPFGLTVTPPSFSSLTPGSACPWDDGASGQASQSQRRCLPGKGHRHRKWPHQRHRESVATI